MPRRYNSLNDLLIDDLSIGLCPVCNERLTAECEHRNEESEVYYAALALAEQTLADEKWKRKHADPRTPEQIALEEWQAEWDDTYNDTRQSGHPV